MDLMSHWARKIFLSLDLLADLGIFLSLKHAHVLWILRVSLLSMYIVCGAGKCLSKK